VRMRMGPGRSKPCAAPGKLHLAISAHRARLPCERAPPDVALMSALCPGSAQ